MNFDITTGLANEGSVNAAASGSIPFVLLCFAKTGPAPHHAVTSAIGSSLWSTTATASTGTEYSAGTGVKTALDASVFAAAAGAFLLALDAREH
jgi:hypothetical protein